MITTKTLLERVADPDEWDGLVQLLTDGGVSQEDAFTMVLGAFFELFEAAASDNEVENAELVPC